MLVSRKLGTERGSKVSDENKVSSSKSLSLRVVLGRGGGRVLTVIGACMTIDSPTSYLLTFLTKYEPVGKSSSVDRKRHHKSLGGDYGVILRSVRTVGTRDRRPTDTRRRHQYCLPTPTTEGDFWFMY